MSSAGVNGPAHGRAVRRKAKPTISFLQNDRAQGRSFYLYTQDVCSGVICSPNSAAFFLRSRD
jgi:hypothetical protein